MKKISLTGVALLALTFVSVPAFAGSDDPVVAKVNGQAIYRSQIMRSLQALGPQAQSLPPQILYPQLLQKAIVTQLVSSKGYAAKMQNDKEVKDRLKLAEQEIVADVYVHKMVTPKITDDKLAAKYKELAAKYKPEQEVRARHILVATEAEANDILKQLKGGADFAKLAGEKSKDAESAKNGGDLDFFTKEQMVKPFADAAFAMKAGDVSSKPVKTDFGYHIIKVEAVRQSSAPTMDQVRDQLANQVGQEVMVQMVKEMLSSAKIEKFDINGQPLKDMPKTDKVEAKPEPASASATPDKK